MNWLRLVMASWRERSLRTFAAAAGVAIATGSFSCLLAFNHGYQNGIRSELDRLGAHVLLAPKGCPYDAASMALHGASWPCYLKQNYLKEVLSVPGIASAAPVFMTALHTTNSLQIVYVGADSNILALKHGWNISGTFPAGKNDVLLGSGLQEKHGWHVGDKLALPGLPGELAAVSGILQPTHGAEDDFCYLRLQDAQRIFRHPDELTHVLLRLSDPDKMDQVVAQLRGCDAGLSMNVVPLAYVFRTIQSVVSSTRTLLACIALVALFIAGAGVSNAILISVSERTREIGVMRAIGATRTHVFALVAAETVQVCMLGGCVGQAAALLLSPAVTWWVRSKLPFVPAGALMQWSWELALVSVLSATILGLVAAFLPAWRASQVPPFTALRAADAFA